MPHAPLVSPGPPLTPAQRQRYARQLSLEQVGDLGQRRLAAARVLMIGAGGLGSPVLTALAAAGVGTLGIVDSDSVEVSNLHRQTIYTMADLARPKAEAAAAALRAHNPLIKVVAHQTRLTAANVLALIADYDIVIDGTDNFATRHLAHDAAALLHKPYIWGSVLRFDGLVTTFWVDGPAGGTRLEDLFPSTPGPDEAETCAMAGVLGSVCASVGAMMATETLKLIVGFGEPLFGRLLVHDGLDASWRELPYGAATATGVTGPLAPAAAADPPRDTSHSQVHTHPIPVQAHPGAPAPDEVTSAELAGLLADRQAGLADFVLVDIREPWERDIVAIDGSALVPMAQLLTDEARTVMEPDDRVILYCHHGARSEYAREVLRDNGWSAVTHLAGGVDDWVRQIEPDKARY
ncbi:MULTISPECIES: ThiF family adenylyltransferase [Cryobacterium]|uniref:Adenylyltransferase/sulfurtransferase MoeZ n=1 Tax=Cryobacterium zongtaii TaxID=1259217 RepID=A0A2S3Z9B5_9MICO|nr:MULTISPECIES: ThiF family adenylyltransferase [Cryobacterium]POH62146.1 adenylyltransferase/sulfurtransferase MoeZ [Cryobacterium zongtaii]POH67996.1 adenylyltransferase/sulfurtransferase MoeZ [Cryobacterium zongtaii]TFC48002.1 adenylyltransferase/sulfurtransferase MoeZ [Cryobacterium sp. TMN-39-2]